MTMFVPYHEREGVRLRTCPNCGKDSDIGSCSYVWDLGAPESIVIWCACGAVMYAKNAPLGVRNPALDQGVGAKVILPKNPTDAGSDR